MNNLIMQYGTGADTATEKHMELYACIAAWAEQRNFKEGATLFGQACKLAEEFGEFLKHYNKGSDCTDDIGDVLVVVTVLRYMLGIHVKAPACCNKHFAGPVGVNIATAHDAISNIMGLTVRWHADTPLALQSELYRLELCVAAICTELGYDVVACLQHSYNEIKDRTGRMIDGKFVKSADLLDLPDAVLMPKYAGGSAEAEQAIRNKSRVKHLRSDCSSLCSEGEPCMVSNDGRCDCDRSPEYPPEVSAPVAPEPSPYVRCGVCGGAMCSTPYGLVCDEGHGGVEFADTVEA